MATVSQVSNVRNCELIQVNTQPPRRITIELQDQATYDLVLTWGNIVRITDDQGNSYNTTQLVGMFPDQFQLQYNW